MALSATFTTISAGQVDADSPLDSVLMDAVRQNMQALYESIVGDVPTYTLSTAHTHNGVDSAPVFSPDSSAGTIRVGGFGGLLIKGGSTVGSTAMTEVWEGVIPRNGTYRFTWTASGSTSIAKRTQIYRNGVAVGTLNDTTAASATYTTDIGGWSIGDQAQLYAGFNTTVSGFQTIVSNFYIWTQSSAAGIVVTGNPVNDAIVSS